MTVGGIQPAPRLEAVERAAAVLRQLAVELEFTNADLLQIVDFLADAARENELMLLSDVLGISRVIDDQTHAGGAGTASNVLGPFYVPESPWIDNPGTVVRSPDAGERLTLVGRVTDAVSGMPIDGAVAMSGKRTVTVGTQTRAPISTRGISAAGKGRATMVDTRSGRSARSTTR